MESDTNRGHDSNSVVESVALPESKGQFLDRMAAAGRGWQRVNEELIQKSTKYNDMKRYFADPEVKQLLTDRENYAQVLTAGEKQVIDQADPQALLQVIKGMLTYESGIAAKIVKRLPAISPNISRSVLLNELNNYTLYMDGEQPRRADPGVDIIAKVAVASVRTTPSR